MKNMNKLPRILLISAIMLFAGDILVAQKDSSFIFTITEDDACWVYDSSSTPQFKIISNSTCELELSFGGKETLDLKENITVFKFEFTPKRDSIILKNALNERSDLKIKSPFKLVNIEFFLKSGDCKFKKTQVTRCNTKGNDESPDGKTDASTSGYLFIPSSEQELEYRKRSAKFEVTTSEECCPGTQELVFDYAAQCLIPTCDLEERICRKCKKESKSPCETCKNNFKRPHRFNALRNFHPQVGNAVRVRIKGANPYRDNLVLHIDAYDRNKEDKAKFQAALDRLAKHTDSTKVKSGSDKSDPDKVNGQALTSDEKLKKFVPKFKAEMAQFYQEKYNADQLTAGFLAQCVLHIQDSIRKHFEISEPSSELIEDKVKQWLKDSKLDKTYYESMIKEGIDYYKKILNYRTSTAWLFQVKNSDITKLGFDWYRDGQRVSANPQTFEFFNKGGFTIDYSVGIAINQLVNYEFTTVAVQVAPDTLKNKVVQKKGSNINLGPIILAHAYYRYPILNRFKVGATTGFMTNTLENDLSLNFLFGGSLLFGSEERFNLTLGGIIGKAARLKEGIVLDSPIYDPPSNNQSAEVATREIYRCKWFVGITYNLGK